MSEVNAEEIILGLKNRLNVLAGEKVLLLQQLDQIEFSLNKATNMKQLLTSQLSGIMRAEKEIRDALGLPPEPINGPPPVPIEKPTPEDPS